MRHLFKNSHSKVGLSPGTVLYTGEPRSEPVVLEVIEYSPKKIDEYRVNSIGEVKFQKPITWINVIGIHNTSIIEEIGKKFNINSLILEDIVNVNHRPKFEEHEDFLFSTLKMILQSHSDFNIEHISIITFKNVVITFQEKEGDLFDNLRKRLRNSKGKIRLKKTDYLMHALHDAIIDNYFPIIEKLGTTLTHLEETTDLDTPHMIAQVHALRRQLIRLRQSAWPLRELINSMMRCDSPLVKRHTDLLLRDTYDHVLTVIDTIDMYREMVSGLQDMLLSRASHKMNKIMKTLTIIATIFIPLTFFAGVYGMNFEHMPELTWKYGYVITLGVMALIGITMAVYFRFKKWL